ncbi:hypothetical protein BD408DRAFT_424198 [Parasitella parasitica]|nr:hypothetical protein BD408DRAFT_424198 [Parasitella parasitica]
MAVRSMATFRKRHPRHSSGIRGGRAYCQVFFFLSTTGLQVWLDMLSVKKPVVYRNQLACKSTITLCPRAFKPRLPPSRC